MNLIFNPHGFTPRSLPEPESCISDSKKYNLDLNPNDLVLDVNEWILQIE